MVNHSKNQSTLSNLVKGQNLMNKPSETVFKKNHPVKPSYMRRICGLSMLAWKGKLLTYTLFLEVNKFK
ncbi:hypothetical protein GCM10007971_28200 [Oceanobacillus indicireducens]|uniref:Uncharacterized protein n=1 Tax=Oceanobacillus indicireducens TaxID=1004261 RepID=A0A917Y1H3_9BACI|nr:hypothetical protein GCM10007971_28200 [Oceanobacillus indicireducens]